MSSTSKPRPSPRRQAVLAILREHGPMTAASAAAHLQWDIAMVSRAIVFARQKHSGEFFRVVRHKGTVGHWGPDQPVYAAEPGPDAYKRPISEKTRRRVAAKRWRDKNSAVEAAKKRASRASSSGAKAVNVWSQLAPPSLRRQMTMVAANTSMAEAA